MTEAAPATPSTPAAAPAATGSPTFAAPAQSTDYQAQTPPAASTESQPAGGNPAPQEPQTPAKQQPEGEKPPEPAAGEPAKPADPNAPEFKLPEEYKDKPWAAKVKTQEDLWKQLANAQELIGKKSIVPNLKDATPEEREAFYAQLRGKDVAEYVIPENPAFPTPKETQPAVAKLFMDNGVSPTQAEAIIKGYQELGAKQLAEQFNPEGFKTSMETAFGDKWETVTGQVRNTITKMMSPEDQKALDAIPNNLLGTVYRTLGNTINAVNETLKKYGATETFAHLGAPSGQATGNDIAAQRTQWRTELAALSSRPHEAAEKDAIIKKIADSYSNDPRLQAS